MSESDVLGQAETMSLMLDRYRHTADKLQKTENVMEKYKKKLQEGADLRQHVRVSLHDSGYAISV